MIELQPRNKFGANRPLYWRFGHYACSGRCEAEFANYALRNAHDLRFHPRVHYGDKQVSDSRRRADYFKLLAQGWLMLARQVITSWLLGN